MLNTNLNLGTNTYKIILLGASLFFFGLISTASAATLQLSPETGEFGSEETFIVEVDVVPDGEMINAVEATLKFDPSVLSVVNISNKDSAFSLWTFKPSFSNSEGVINFGGGSPSPLSSPSNIINVTFRAINVGETEISFSGASILRADEERKDVYEVSSSSQIKVIANKPNNQLTTKINSQTFNNSEAWYKTTEGLFIWALPFGSQAVAVEISTSSDNVPNLNDEAIHEPPISEYSVTKEDLVEGEQYLSISFKDRSAWSEPIYRKLLIDTVPPEPFSIETNSEETASSSFPILLFQAEDKTSGLAYYEVIIGNDQPVKLTPQQLQPGYLLKDIEDGSYLARVIAYDKAGNSQISTKQVVVNAGWIEPETNNENKAIANFLTSSFLQILLLVTIVILLMVHIWRESVKVRVKEEKLRREVVEVQDQTEKIFSALRDEIYDQISNINNRKRLSKSEKEVVAGLTQALEVSETLIEKEIYDVKSILK